MLKEVTMKKFFTLFILIFFCATQLLPAFAIREDDYLSAQRETVHLGSRLHKKYEGGIFRITNKSQEHIVIQDVVFDGSVNSDVAYSTIHRSSLKMGFKMLAGGILYTIPTLGISLVGAVVVTPFAVMSNSIGNLGAHQDCHRYHHPIKSGVLAPETTFEGKIIMLKGQPSRMTVLYNIEGNDETRTLRF